MTVLLVEDDARNAALVRRALRAAGARANLDLVYDGAEAVEFIYSMGTYSWRGRNAPLDAVVLDLDVPKLSGLELMSVLRFHPRTRQIPIIALAASADDERIAECERLSPAAIVQKPLEWREMVEIFRFIWGERQETRRTGRPTRS